MKLDILTLDNKKSSVLELDKSVFEAEIRADILHRMVTWQLAKRRSGSRKTLERSEVTGSRAKIVRQKGSGGARHGDRKVSQYRGGGVAHGPRVRSHEHKLPRKVRNMAMRCALSSKVKEGKLIILEDISFTSMKTKLLKQALSKLPLGKSTLFVSGDKVDENFNKALKNIPMHDMLPTQGANVYDILRRDTLVLSKTSVEMLVSRLVVSEKKPIKSKEVK
ncbi:50S ribosomal protein L4 [Alphaproteobacteria bacterium]|jgi:large subunit ribosomal protein L4|nr:50S ribosomal protein L4 [Alphaproteobacteria bacterium]|tara:strand:- start:185 stop:847 length:663 start_codon:yes stop_codon:yes gene_type:complete